MKAMVDSNQRLPTPCSWTVCGLLGAVSVTRSCSFLVPGLCGWKSTWKLQDWPAANVEGVAGHVVLTILKSTPTFQLVIVSFCADPLLSVTVLAAELWPMVIVPKFSVDGSSVTAGVGVGVGVLVAVGVGVAVGVDVCVGVGVAVGVRVGVGVAVCVAVAVAVAVGVAVRVEVGVGVGVNVAVAV